MKVMVARLSGFLRFSFLLLLLLFCFLFFCFLPSNVRNTFCLVHSENDANVLDYINSSHPNNDLQPKLIDSLSLGHYLIELIKSTILE